MEYKLDMGGSGPVSCNSKFNPTVPLANFSAVKYRYFNPPMFVDAAELARLKGYLSKRAAGGGIAPGVPQGPDFSHGGQPPNHGHFQSPLYSMRPCPLSICC